MAAYESYWLIWFAMMCIVTIFGFLAYIALLLVVLSTANLRQSPSNSFIVALSLTGLLATSVVFPWAIVLYFNYRSGSKKWPVNSHCSNDDIAFPWSMCSTFGAVHNFSIYNSVWLVSAIAIERHVSITRPFYSPSALSYALLSVVSTACSLLFALIPSLLSPEQACASLYGYRFDDPVFSWIQFILVFLIPIFIIVIMYIKIYRVAQNVRSAIQPIPSIPTTNETTSTIWTIDPVVLVPQTASVSVPNIKRNKAIRTLVLTVGSYVALWSPYWLLKMVIIAHQEDLVCDAQQWYVANNGSIAVTWLMYASISINPLLYGLLNRAIRLEIKRKFQMMRRVWLCSHRTESTNQEDAGVDGLQNFWEFLERTNSPIPG